MSAFASSFIESLKYSLICSSDISKLFLLSANEIKIALKNQLCLIFSNGLKYCDYTSKSTLSLIKSNLPANAVRALVEKPYAWEYKFLACVLKDEFDKLQERRWDFKYGVFDGPMYDSKDPQTFIDFIIKKFNEAIELTNLCNTIINDIINDAIGEL